MTAIFLACAMLLDAILGEPRWLWSRVPHPAVLIGDAIGWADKTFNKGAFRRLKGAILVTTMIAAACLIGLIVDALPFTPLLEIALVAVLLAHRSLVAHVTQVAQALAGTLGEGRRAVARIVGRDTGEMDEPAVARAAIESAAENLSDGVVAPAVFYLVFGLPGILAYKAINTADSMIGYRTERHSDFGWAAARADDVLNWVPARLTAIMIAALAGEMGQWRAIAADARLHRSPNAGWPEAAMARALNVALSGPRSYEGAMRDFPYVHSEGRKDTGPVDIRAAVGWLWRVWWAALALVLVMAVIR